MKNDNPSIWNVINQNFILIRPTISVSVFNKRNKRYFPLPSRLLIRVYTIANYKKFSVWKMDDQNHKLGLR